MKEPTELMFRDLRDSIFRQNPTPSECTIKTIDLLEKRAIKVEDLLMEVYRRSGDLSLESPIGLVRACLTDIGRVDGCKQ